MSERRRTDRKVWFQTNNMGWRKRAVIKISFIAVPLGFILVGLFVVLWLLPVFLLIFNIKITTNSVPFSEGAIQKNCSWFVNNNSTLQSHYIFRRQRLLTSVRMLLSQHTWIHFHFPVQGLWRRVKSRSPDPGRDSIWKLPSLLSREHIKHGRDGGRKGSGKWERKIRRKREQRCSRGRTGRRKWRLDVAISIGGTSVNLISWFL